jgi:16S rRNA (cytosine967-C5)-methyltransferase
MKPNPDALSLAAGVVSQADRDHPADAVLRRELKARRGLSQALASEVSRAVFAFCRWRGWIDRHAPLPKQIGSACEIRDEFRRSPEGFPDGDLQAKAVPQWVAGQVEVSPAWVRALQQEPKVWLRARRGQGRGLAEQLGHCRVAGEGLLADALEYSGEEDLFRTEAFQAGAFELQDFSSQWVGWLCHPQARETWWDACAGEGGKLLHLSDLMENQGLVWASDRAEWRLRRLKRRAARARVFNYRMAPWDGGEKLPTGTRFDGVLMDAPCSGLGTWHRNPHARWTVTPADVAELRELQVRLLTHAAQSLKPGGRLVYSVCTLTRAETLEVVERFEEQCTTFKPLPMVDPLNPGDPEGSRLWSWPQDRGGSGMFVAAWRA